MYRIIAPIALAAVTAAIPLAAQDAPIDAPPRLTMEQQTALRCGVTFGMVAGAQEIGDGQAMTYPPMEPRGKEFFVRTMARLMDEQGLTREQIARLALAEVNEMKTGGMARVKEIMPACLLMLEASGV